VKSPVAIMDVDMLVETLRQAPPFSENQEMVHHADHGLQCAELLATWFPGDIELSVAGLFHDIAHCFSPGENHELEHGRIAADVLGSLFSPRVCKLVELHVPAKRYLCTFDESYGAGLSPVSVRTMGLQGGEMPRWEADFYSHMAEWSDALHLRRADDMAKTPGAQTRSLDDWVPVLRALSGQLRL
jgi:predicted HD phosphohydrolase